jgi:hypothetical protein
MIKLPGLPKRAIALAFLLAFLLSFGLMGTAGATAVSTQGASSATIISCISATPASQVVNVTNPARVKAVVTCLPPYASPVLPGVQVAWGDGSITRYPLCGTITPVCDPPFIVETMHSYAFVGDYHPLICVDPSPIVSSGAVNPYCTTVNIQVVSL